MLHSKKGQDYLASAIFRAFRSYKQSIDQATLQVDNKEFKKEEKKKVAIEKIEPKPAIFFKVQIGTYLKDMKNSVKFSGLNAEEKVINGTFKYFIGNTSSKDEVDKLRIKMVEKGFNGAFVIAFKDGIRINVKEALSLQK